MALTQEQVSRAYERLMQMVADIDAHGKRLGEIEARVTGQTEGCRVQFATHRELIEALQARIDNVNRMGGEQERLLRERVTELEELSARVGHGWATEIKGRVAALDDHSGIAHESVRTLAKRIEALEGGHQQDGATQDNILNAQQGLLERVQSLEEFVGNDLVEFAERERQERWHRTYNATWPALANRYQPYMLIFADRNANPIGDCDRHDEEVRGRLDWLHMAASNIADRAHGPLEAKAKEVPAFYQDVPELVALVRAARERVAHDLPNERLLDQYGCPAGSCGASIVQLRAALKHFEGVS